MTRIRQALTTEPAWMLGAAAVLFQVVDMLLVIAVDALFLRRLGPSYLPYAYVAVNAGAILLALIVLSVRSASTFWLALGMTAVLGVASLASVPFIGGGSALVFFVIFLVVRLHDKLCFSYFLTYVQGVFPVREGKRKVSLVLAASSAGCILAGLSVRPMITRVSMEALFVVAAVFSGALVLVMIACAKLWPVRRVATVTAETPARHPLPEALSMLKTHPLARRLASLFFLTMLLRYLVEFQFSRTIVTLYPDDVQLASFVGSFRAGIALLFTMGQLFLTSRLLVTLQPGGTILAITLLQTALAALTVGVGGSLPVLAMQALWNIGYQTCIRPAFGIMLAPLDPQTRDRVGILTSLADAAGCVGSGLILIGFQDRLDVRALFLGILLMYFVILAMARRLNADYFLALETSVLSADAGTRIESMRALDYMSAREIEDRLRALLPDPDPSVRLAAVERLDSLSPESAEPMVEALLQHEADPRVMAALVRVLPRVLGVRARPLLAELCDRAPDERVLANLVEAVGQVGGPPPEPALVDHLDHPSRRVQAAAVLTALRLGVDRAPIGRALRRLATLLRAPDPDTRSAGLIVLGELRRPVFGRAAGHYLDDGSPAVRLNAVRAVEKLRPAYLLEKLQGMALEDPAPEVRQGAQRAIRTLEGEGTSDLVRSLRRLAPKDRARAVTFMKSARTPVRLKILEQLLKMELTQLPAELLELVRHEEDPAILEVVTRTLEPGAVTLAPLARALAAVPATPGTLLRLLAVLGRLVPAPIMVEMVENGVTLVLLLNLAATRSAAPQKVELDELRRVRLEQLLLWIAALEAPGDQPALVKSLEGAFSTDRHLASMSLDVLESRLRPEVFKAIGPVLEVLRDEARLAGLSSRWIRSHAARIPSILEDLVPFLSAESWSRVRSAGESP